jgi:hypothetical protein
MIVPVASLHPHIHQSADCNEEKAMYTEYITTGCIHATTRAATANEALQGIDRAQPRS